MKKLAELKAEFARVDAEHTANSERVRNSANKREELRKAIEAAEQESVELPAEVDGE